MSAADIRAQRPWLIPAVLVLLGLPLVLVLVEAAYFHAQNRSNGSIESGGRTREYLLHVPASYDPASPAPLVISMHPAGMWPAFQMRASGWNRLADEHGFIVVYPAGRGVPRIFPMDGWKTPAEMPDVRFVSDLIDSLAANYNIDTARIYADGFSNGGGMAFVLSCTLSHRIAAVGLVSSAQLLPWRWCADPKPVPMIAFHGTADSFTPYAGGKVWIARNPFPSIPAWTANWAQRNRCGPIPVESAPAVDTTRREYTGCADNADVVLYTIQGGGHTWPGGEPLPEWFVGTTTRNVDATRVMWAFFKGHPLQVKSK